MICSCDAILPPTHSILNSTPNVHQIAPKTKLLKKRDLPMRTLCWSLANLAASILAVNKRYKLD